MKQESRMTAALLMSAGLALAAGTPVSAGGGKSIGKPSGVVPATLESIEGSDIRRVILTERAAQRIDLKTDAVRECGVAGKACMIVPYSSLIYDPNGGTWVYTNPEALSFVRVPVDVVSIAGDEVTLRKGPAVGTMIATVGVAELYGTEFEVGH